MSSLPMSINDTELTLDGSEPSHINQFFYHVRSTETPSDANFDRSIASTDRKRRKLAHESMSSEVSQDNTTIPIPDSIGLHPPRTHPACAIPPAETHSPTVANNSEPPRIRPTALLPHRSPRWCRFPFPLIRLHNQTLPPHLHPFCSPLSLHLNPHHTIFHHFNPRHHRTTAHPNPSPPSHPHRPLLPRRLRTPQRRLRLQPHPLGPRRMRRLHHGRTHIRLWSRRGPRGRSEKSDQGRGADMYGSVDVEGCGGRERWERWERWER